MQCQVLVVEHNPGGCELAAISGLFNTEFVVEAVSSLREAQAFIEKSCPNAVVMELDVADSRGIETLRAIVKLVPNEVAVIVWADEYDNGLALAAIKVGAQDYITKEQSVNSKEFSRTIRKAVERQKIRALNLHYTTLNRSAEQIKESGSHFGLNGSRHRKEKTVDNSLKKTFSTLQKISIDFEQIEEMKRKRAEEKAKKKSHG